MKPGTVFVFKKIKYPDGETGDIKFLILLNTPSDDEPYLFCLTTTQQHTKKAVLGCHHKQDYYYIDRDQSDFWKPTWVVFDTLYVKSAADLTKRKFYSSRYEMFDIEITLWKALKKCILKSKNIDQDHLEMIARE